MKEWFRNMPYCVSAQCLLCVGHQSVVRSIRVGMISSSDDRNGHYIFTDKAVGRMFFSRSRQISAERTMFLMILVDSLIGWWLEREQSITLLTCNSPAMRCGPVSLVNQMSRSYSTSGRRH
ncbi:hypothetical protein BDW22DRAFT_847118 [Trametopsis cervina]|nr:hypothetical protein BDW22DRAFT_847118 [Trametopsis cervina]